MRFHFNIFLDGDFACVDLSVCEDLRVAMVSTSLCPLITSPVIYLLTHPSL